MSWLLPDLEINRNWRFDQERAVQFVNPTTTTHTPTLSLSLSSSPKSLIGRRRGHSGTYRILLFVYPDLHLLLCWSLGEEGLPPKGEEKSVSLSKT